MLDDNIWDQIVNGAGVRNPAPTTWPYICHRVAHVKTGNYWERVSFYQSNSLILAK